MESNKCSEELSVQPCDPCNYDNTPRDSRGYCFDCNEYLCNECIQFHRKFQATRGHPIATEESMPKTRLASDGEKLSILLCDDHRMKQCEFYCKCHDVVFCGLCKAMKHNECSIETINDICSEEDTIRKQFTEHCDQLKKQTEVLKMNKLSISDKIDQAKQSIKECKESVQEKKTKVLELFSCLETVIQESEEELLEHCLKTRQSIQLYDDMMNHVNDTNDKIQQAEKQKSLAALFIMKIKSQNVLKECKYAACLLQGQKDQLFTISFEITSDLTTVLEKAINPGKIIKTNLKTQSEITETNNENAKRPSNDSPDNTRQSLVVQKEETKVEATLEVAAAKTDIPGTNSRDTSNQPRPTSVLELKWRDKLIFMDKHFRDNTALQQRKFQNKKYVFDQMTPEITKKLDVNVSSDKDKSYITGVVVLPSGRAVLCDNSNGKLKLLNNQFQVVYVLKVSSKPFDVSKRNAEEVIITVSNDRVLMFVCVSENGLSFHKKLATKRFNWGIEVLHENIFVTQHNNPGQGSLQVRKMDGQVLFEINFSDWYGSDVLQAPCYISIHFSREAFLVYVTGSYEDGMVKVDLMKGNIAYIDCKGFSWPKDMITDANGKCLLAARFCHKLILLENDHREVGKSTNETSLRSRLLSRTVTTWLSEIKDPQSIDIRPCDKTVLVGTKNSGVYVIQAV
ncbi:uncharacterized protein LOC128233367 [Mya arenaria]|uniref:uncharacterized protein LOC128233367 n=1 Tax=Mya arenaria TaxID=6604 RepID=UPI0022E63382|nr:uncharacterized protein LOC128233367 [Mya arenaria]